jgi:hypothetical protein
VDTPAFEWFILVLIFASSITLCFEDIYLDQNIVLKNILYWTNLGFCALFSIEMMLKWLALGFWRYFTSFWTILDFIIVFVSNSSTEMPSLLHHYVNLYGAKTKRYMQKYLPLSNCCFSTAVSCINIKVSVIYGSEDCVLELELVSF